MERKNYALKDDIQNDLVSADVGTYIGPCYTTTGS